MTWRRWIPGVVVVLILVAVAIAATAGWIDMNASVGGFDDWGV